MEGKRRRSAPQQALPLAPSPILREAVVGSSQQRTARMGEFLHSHPYVPTDLILPGFVPCFLSQSTILAVYGIASLAVVSSVWIFSGYLPKIIKSDRFLMCWWAFTGLTHLTLEGYFVFSPKFYQDKTGCYLAEVCKSHIYNIINIWNLEYLSRISVSLAKGDSRYAARDAGIVAVEGITAVLEGPASLLVVYAIACGKSYSYILQFAISLGQLYGAVVYFTTAILEGDNFSANQFYYFTYYIGANASWLVIPLLIATRSWRKTSAAFQVQGQTKKAKVR
ncbi:probable 3-beta-hydroxysteroid-Delta(8),Delta(7)-isomerase [Neltuma alba]|uniref:probable 3-beta-hydroxysteroid-Delta(8),Delta(7)-isomerase n=1 Tax=Neltuma alba TaxID=207710 RepID=UPI0010A3ECDB|nr:probable 3-beta-hydroxysteroid-Delta(8),Delta(7)-isomerase [Prosopis alba]